jgi:hypothetical protein
MTLTTTPSTFADAVVTLGRQVRGRVIMPGEAGYDAARAGWDASVDQHPTAIVMAADAGDVAEAVRFARATDLPIAVQATGHGGARPADGAVLVVTSELTGVSVDPVQRTAYVQAGAKWAAVLAAAEPHGLAPLLGSASDVGAVGYTLGGGMGWLGRRYGLAADSARSFDLVTPDGVELRAAAHENPELFWALRGGGAGAFGVVTGTEIELYPVTTVYAGNLLYPIEMAREVVAHWRDWIACVPAELTSAVLVMNFPPFEEVPEPIRGRSFVIVRGCFSGDLAAGRALIDEWRSWRAPAIDMFGPMPFAESDRISNDPIDPVPFVGTTEWFDTMPDAAIDTIVAATEPVAGPPVLVFSEIRHAGGAIRTKGTGAANERGRSGEMLLFMMAVTPDAASARAARAHLDGVRAELAPYVNGAAYLNFLNGAERQGRTAEAFHPAHHQRLVAVKEAVDPDRRFRHGFAF